MVYERFTQEACDVTTLAQKESRRLGKNRIGTEQILCASIEEERGVASQVLRSLGITLTEARLKVEQLTGFGLGVTATEAILYSPRAERVVVLSSEEALQLGSNFIDTEHLLLALIQEKDSVAVEVLKRLGVEIEQVFTQLCKAMNQ